MTCSVIHGRKMDSLSMRTLVSRTSCIVNSPELSDVKFIFKNVSGSGSAKGQGQGTETIIYGHKVIIALGSPVFHRMFYVDKTSQQFVTTVNDEVHMKGHGVSAEAFLEFIRFLYTDEIDYENLTLELIIGILNCADYYDVPCLRNECLNQLETIITKENVIRILETAETFCGRNLAEKALRFIDRNLESVVEYGDILCVKLDTLVGILKRDSLDIDECFVLDLALKWAGKECRRENQKPTAEKKRQVLGKAFFEIRFGLLPSAKICELVSSRFLTQEESLIILLEVHTCAMVTRHPIMTYNPQRLGFQSNPRIFAQKIKLNEVAKMEEKWKEMNNLDYLKAMSLATTRGNLTMTGFPVNKTEEELANEIHRNCPVFHVSVNQLRPNTFRVEFLYNSSEIDTAHLLSPLWYEFDNPATIQILMAGLDEDW